MSDIRPVSDIQRQMALQKQERAKKLATRKTSLGEDSISTTSGLSNLQSMVEKLGEMDDIRPEMVELGKKLANSKDFPSGDSLDKLAEALLSPVDFSDNY